MEYEITQWIKKANAWQSGQAELDSVLLVIGRAEMAWNAKNDNSPTSVKKILTDADLKAQAVGDWGKILDKFLEAVKE